MTAKDLAGNTNPVGSATPPRIFFSVQNNQPTVALVLATDANTSGISTNYVPVRDKNGNAVNAPFSVYKPTATPPRIAPPAPLYFNGAKFPTVNLQYDNADYRTFGFSFATPNGASAIPGTAIEGAKPQSYANYSITPSVEGLYQFSDIAINAGGTQTSFTSMSFVIDNKAPTARIVSPVQSATVPPIANILPARPASFLTLQFTIDAAGTSTANAFAPLLTYSADKTTYLNEPSLALQIYDMTAKKLVTPIYPANPAAPASAIWPVPAVWSLHTALAHPNLTIANGSASVTGDAASQYSVTWQLLMSPSVFTINHIYRIDLMNITDVAGNVASNVAGQAQPIDPTSVQEGAVIPVISQRQIVAQSAYFTIKVN